MKATREYCGDPKGMSIEDDPRGPFGAAFLRWARLIFLRSILSVMLVVFAMNGLGAFLEKRLQGALPAC